MNIKRKSQEDFICENCKNKYLSIDQNNPGNEDFEEEKHCFYCKKVKIEKLAKCLYKGLPSCFSCASSSNYNVNKVIINSKTMSHPSTFSKKNTMRNADIEKISTELILTEKVASNELENPLSPREDTRIHLNLKDLKIDITQLSNNYSSNNLSTSISTPTQKSILDIVSNNKYSTRKASNIPKSPLDRLNTAVEVVFKGIMNEEPFNYQEIFYPLLWENKKGEHINIKSLSKIGKGNYMILFMDKVFMLTFGSVLTTLNQNMSLSKIFKIKGKNNGIIYLDHIFDNFYINDKKISFCEGSYFDLIDFQFISDKNIVNSFVEMEKNIVYIKIYEIF